MKMQESVLRRVRTVEEKNGIKYARTDGALYKTLRVLYFFAFAYTLIINLLYMLGMVIAYGGTEDFKYVANSFISVCVCTAVMVVGLVLSFFRFKIAAGIISIAPEIFLITVFGSRLRDDIGFLGFSTSFYWRHFIPLALLVILMIVTTVIAVRARIKTEKQYKKVTDNLYELYKANFTDVTDEQWEEFLNNYDPTDYKKLFKAE
ncbi:MAG: hypothetical protein UHO61_07345 [Acutalibacteraceae bacterium]|nr:hypothetical protein [Acutalibacteraceae bacterium]